MRRYLAVVLLLLTTGLACVDTFACPDGCTQEAQHPETAPLTPTPHGECLLCQTAMSVAVSAPALTVSGTVEPLGPAPAARQFVSPTLGIDHPPRTA